MKGIGRSVTWSILLLLTFIGFMWPAIVPVSSQAGGFYDPVVITNLRADFVIDRDGHLDATETITGDFPGDRHGIFRYWDVANPNNPGVRQPPEVTEVLLDGQPVQYQMLWEDRRRFRVAKIGDPHRFVDYGTHVFRIRYTTDGVLDPGSTGVNKTFASSIGDPSALSAFFWNVIAPAWNNRISQADISITLPGNVTGAGCSIGHDIGRECAKLTVSGNRVEVSATGLAPRTPVTVRAGVDVPTPARAELPWSFRWDRVLGQSVPVVWWLLGLTAVAGLGSWLWWRTVVESPPGFPLQYAPPKGLGPVQCDYIRTEKVPREGLTATLFYLADRGLVSLKQVGGKKWSVQATHDRGAWADVDPVSVFVGSALGITGPGARFDANGTVSSGRKLSSAGSELAVAVRKWALDEGLMVKRGRELWLREANVVAFVGALCGFAGWGFPMTLWGLPFAAFFLFSARSWSRGVGTRRTPAGRELWSQAGGFHRMLTTDSAEARFDFAARKDLYAAYVPFAIAGGAAALWAAKYKTATGQVPPQPDWYHTSSNTSWASASSGGASFDSFKSALSSSIGAYTASQSSSSSSSSGGSSSGGGGGGGGGGGEEAVHGELSAHSDLGDRGSGPDRICLGLQQSPSGGRPGRRGLRWHRRAVDPPSVLDSRPRQHG